MEIDLLSKYPKSKRDTKLRAKTKSVDQVVTASKYDWEYFDKKGICYGGYYYDGRWIQVAEDFIEFYNLYPGDKILDVGCAKGYMLYDFYNAGMDTYGVDISRYAIGCVPHNIKDHVYYMNAKDLISFGDDEFDLVISINTIHNLPEKDCRKAVREIQRVGKHAYIVVDSYGNNIERERMMEWNVTGVTIKSIKDWIKLFREEGYTGDYYWFIP